MYYGDYRPDPERRDNTQPSGYPMPPAPWPEGTGCAPQVRKKKNHTGTKIAALGLCCALLGGAAGGGLFWYLGRQSSTTLYQGGHEPVKVETASIRNGQVLTPPELYAANVNSCVGITTELVQENGFGYRVRGAAAGSGFVVSADGYIVTNYHVIKGATSIQVAFLNGDTYDAALVGGEAENDIAVLKIEASGLAPVQLGDSDTLVVGETVYTIGNPLGELTWTLTDGLVSAKDRKVTTSEGETMNMLQTNTAINSGNSGGPLFNAYGEVVGITSAKLSNSSGSSTAASIEGLGFAIPINDVREMIEDIITHGYVTGKPNIGILMNDVASEAVQYGVPQGVYIEAVLSGSCADRGGLKQGDIVTAMDREEVTSGDALKAAVRQKKAGDTITLSVFRSGEKVELTLTLDEDNQQRQDALSDLQDALKQQRQEELERQQQQQQQNGGYYYSWPFGFGY